MTSQAQRVKLVGGSFHGSVASGPIVGRALRIPTMSGDDRWTEVYVHFAGRTAEDPATGQQIPEMLFLERRQSED